MRAFDVAMLGHGPFATPAQCASSYDWTSKIDYGYDDQGRLRRRAGLCCNHIHFRSLSEFFKKLKKNNNKGLFDLKHVWGTNASSPLWAFYEQVEDVDALDLMRRLSKDGD